MSPCSLNRMEFVWSPHRGSHRLVTILTLSFLIVTLGCLLVLQWALILQNLREFWRQCWICVLVLSFTNGVAGPKHSVANRGSQ